MTGRRRSISPAQVLAIAAVPLLSLQAWTWGAWLRDGPVQLTRYRDTAVISWPVAGALEVLAIVALVVVIAPIVVTCVRERRLTLDARFCIAGALTYFWDPMSNLMQPLFLYSSQWINLSDWTGNLPFSRYPDGGRLPEAVLFTPAVFVVGFLLGARIIALVARTLDERHPHFGRLQRLSVMLLVGGVLDACVELPIAAAGLWAFPGLPGPQIGLVRGLCYPTIDLAFGAAVFTGIGLLYTSKNDCGETVFDRGLGHLSPRRCAAVRLLAPIGAFNLIFVTFAISWATLGLFSGPYPNSLPAQLVNGACDAGGFQGTRYGPCPGTPGAPIPLPGGLPGSRPAGNDKFLNGPTQCEGCAAITQPSAPHR